MATRFARAGRRLAVAAILLFALFGLGPVGKALIEPLEDRFPPWDADHAVLRTALWCSAARSIRNSSRRAVRPISMRQPSASPSSPCLRAAYPQARIIYSGGNARIVYRGGSEADAAATLLETFGIPRDRLILEHRSRNTAENAEFVLPLASPKPGERWLLVTSAYHMPRAVGAFREVGFAVEAYPVDYRTRGVEDISIPFDDVASGLRRTDTASREWIGMFVYWLTGKSSAIFPGP